jgi:predicted RNase H-like HicB family nuclease
MKDYHINIFYSEEDEGYVADIPDLEAARAEGKPVPSPKYRPAIYQVSP